MKKLVVIDGKSVFYRGYYAMGTLSTKDGQSTSGVYGFAVIAMEIVRRLKPDKVVVAWDKAGTSTEKRLAIYPEYKAGRVKPPEDFYAQIPLLKELIAALSWGFLECDGYEADDIIGTLAHQVADSASSADALLSRRMPNTAPSATPASSHNSATNAQPWSMVIISSDLDMLQVVNDNVVMYRVMRGFSDIQKMDVAAVEEKYGIKKEQFLDLKALKGDSSDNIPGVPGIGEKGAAKLLEKYGDLDGIYANLGEIAPGMAKRLEAGKELAYMSKSLAKIMTDAPVTINEIPDFVIDGKRVLRELNKLEFRSLVKRFEREILGHMDEAEEEEVEEAEDLPEDVIIDFNIKKKMHEDERLAKRILAGEKFWDLEQGRFLLDPLVRRNEDEVIDKKREYWRQKKLFEKNEQLYRIFTEYDLPLIPVLYKMEKWGIKLDKEYFGKLKEEYEVKINELVQEINELAGVAFNINSPMQLSEILFEKMGLPVKGIKKTSRGYSTGAKELEKLKDEHPIIPKILEYREVAKLLSTYILPLTDMVDKESRIHTTFTQNVTATGRLSSLNPNLQNIPVRTEAGKRIREGFIAPEGRCFVSADYSQFELRLAAVLSGDDGLTETFNSGVDVHTKTASEVFGVPMSEVTKRQRRAAKVINFGVLYGMSAKGLAEAAGMNVVEAKEFIDHYFEVRKAIRKYLDDTLAQARNEGYVATFYGRRRPTPDVKSSNYMIRMGAERAAQNMPIQGTEADLMKRAMIKVDKLLPEGAELILQVHDSLIVECETELREEVSEILRKTMEGIAPELPISFNVEVTSGNNWGVL